MKIYTKTGDAGETGLLGGVRVRKSVLRVEAYGDIDELNACLGLAAVCLGNTEAVGLVRRIQLELFALSARLADVRAAGAAASDKTAFSEERVTGLERAIDAAEAALPGLQAFLLPGGSEAGARLHLARTVCRRAERRLVALAAQEEVPPVFLAYLNRLSDLLFVLARSANARAGVPEVAW